MGIACLLLAGSVQAQEYFGARIDAGGAMTMAELVKAMDGREAMDVKVRGTVLECCQSKGCWMKVDAGDGNTMHVKFKDYGFFVPMNSAGKTAIMQGTASMKTTSVEELKHYAEDGGKSSEEIERITEPRRQLVFVAEGVVLQD
jgi:hypothetical protein